MTIPGIGGAGPSSSSGASPGNHSFSVPNRQGLNLSLSGGLLSVALPPELRVNGVLVNTQRSITQLTCTRAHAPSLNLPGRMWRPGSNPVAWQLGGNQTAITSCSGSVTLAHGGITNVNQDTNIAGFRLDRWRIG